MKNIEVVAAVIKRGDKIFATQRGYGEFKDYWEFPGGKIETGESAEDALHREIMEELDAKIKIVSKIDTIEYDYPDFHITLHCFLCTLAHEHIELKEHEAAKWLSAELLDSVSWLPADMTLIEKLKEL